MLCLNRLGLHRNRKKSGYFPGCRRIRGKHFVTEEYPWESFLDRGNSWKWIFLKLTAVVTNHMTGHMMGCEGWGGDALVHDYLALWSATKPDQTVFLLQTWLFPDKWWIAVGQYVSSCLYNCRNGIWALHCSVTTERNSCGCLFHIHFVCLTMTTF